MTRMATLHLGTALLHPRSAFTAIAADPPSGPRVFFGAGLWLALCPPFFAYVDRWMGEADRRHLATIRDERGKDYSSLPQGRAWDEFATAMWRAHR